MTGDENAIEVLENTFVIGSKLLVDSLPSIFDGTIPTINQDDSKATTAPKLEKDDGLIDFNIMDASTIHNKCRAFAEWPGTFTFYKTSRLPEPQRIKLVKTELIDINAMDQNIFKKEKSVQLMKHKGKEKLIVRCMDNSFIAITQLQPVGKKVMDVKSFGNGFRGEFDVNFC